MSSCQNLSQTVTHVGILAGGGGSQLFDLLTLARKGIFFREVSADSDERANYLLNQWSLIQSDPMNAEKMFFGFAYRRWSTFLATSPIEELRETSAKIYIAQGTDDEAVDATSAEILFAQLKSKNKDVIYERVLGADHSFNFKDNLGKNGWKIQFEKIFQWISAE